MRRTNYLRRRALPDTAIGNLALSYDCLAATEDISPFDLAEQLTAAQYTFQAAAMELARAERRLRHSVLDTDIPLWFVAREQAEAAAEAQVQVLYERIVQAHAWTKAGLAIKLQILAGLCRNDATLVREELSADIVSLLIQSIVRDVSPESAPS